MTGILSLVAPSSLRAAPPDPEGPNAASAPSTAKARRARPEEVDRAALQRALQAASPKAVGPRAANDRLLAIRARKAKERTAVAQRALRILDGKAVPPAYAKALERHARRMADIDRIIEIAQAEQDPSTEARAKALRAREIARHGAWLARFETVLQRKARDEQTRAQPKEGDEG